MKSAPSSAAAGVAAPRAAMTPTVAKAVTSERCIFIRRDLEPPASHAWHSRSPGPEQEPGAAGATRSSKRHKPADRTTPFLGKPTGLRPGYRRGIEPGGSVDFVAAVARRPRLGADQAVQDRTCHRLTSGVA